MFRARNATSRVRDSQAHASIAISPITPTAVLFTGSTQQLRREDLQHEYMSVALDVKSTKIQRPRAGYHQVEADFIDAGYLRLAKQCRMASGHPSAMCNLLHSAIVVGVDVEAVWVVARQEHQ